VSHEDVWIGGGLYAPLSPLIQKVREHIAGNHRRMRSIIESAAFRRTIGSIEGEQLQRMPRGFPNDHAAGDLLRYRQFLAGRELPPAFSSSPKFYPTLLETFRVIVPFIRFLNEPLA
jgi:uncharacterized protein (DUF2461 family)